MSTVPLKYPLDYTGESTANKVVDEPKVLNGSKNRIFIMTYGAFFRKSLVVKDAASNRVLTPDVDFFATELYELPTKRSGKQVCCLAVVVDPTCGPNILVSAQMLGGEYSYSYDAIVQLVEALKLDERPADWPNIINKPLNGYPAAPHLHDAGDLYGFEYVTAGLERIAQAIALGSSAGEIRIFDYVDKEIAKVNARITALLNTQLPT